MRPSAPPLGPVLSGVSARAGAQDGPEGGLGVQHVPAAFCTFLLGRSADLLAPARWPLSNHISYYKSVS